MYKLKMLLLPLVLLLFATQNINAQMTHDEMIDEVYDANFFVNNPNLRTFLLVLLQDRIHYEYSPQTPNEKFTHLSTIPLLDKMNHNLVRDQAYVENVFNPIKYQMDFFAKTTKVYRIDPSTIIIIDPQF